MPQTARHAFKVVAALTEPWILLCCTRRYQKSHDCHWNTLNTCILATPFQPLHWHSLDFTHWPFLTYMTVHNCLILTENGQHSPPRLEPWRRVWAWLAWPVYRARPTCRAWPTCRARPGWPLWASLWCLWWPGIHMFFDDFLISSLSGKTRKGVQIKAHHKVSRFKWSVFFSFCQWYFDLVKLSLQRYFVDRFCVQDSWLRDLYVKLWLGCLLGESFLFFFGWTKIYLKIGNSVGQICLNARPVHPADLWRRRCRGRSDWSDWATPAAAVRAVPAAPPWETPTRLLFHVVLHEILPYVACKWWQVFTKRWTWPACKVGMFEWLVQQFGWFKLRLIHWSHHKLRSIQKHPFPPRLFCCSAACIIRCSVWSYVSCLKMSETWGNCFGSLRSYVVSYWIVMSFCHRLNVFGEVRRMGKFPKFSKISPPGPHSSLPHRPSLPWRHLTTSPRRQGNVAEIRHGHRPESFLTSLWSQCSASASDQPLEVTEKCQLQHWLSQQLRHKFNNDQKNKCARISWNKMKLDEMCFYVFGAVPQRTFPDMKTGNFNSFASNVKSNLPLKSIEIHVTSIDKLVNWRGMHQKRARRTCHHHRPSPSC